MIMDKELKAIDLLTEIPCRLDLQAVEDAMHTQYQVITTIKPRNSKDAPNDRQYYLLCEAHRNVHLIVESHIALQSKLDIAEKALIFYRACWWDSSMCKDVHPNGLLLADKGHKAIEALKQIKNDPS